MPPHTTAQRPPRPPARAPAARGTLTGRLSRCALFLALLLALGAAAFPLLLSYAVGGWVAKHTSRFPFAVVDIPRLEGRVAVVTGGNTGIGLETVRELARKGAEVVLTARDLAKGEAAAERVRASVAKDLEAAGLPGAKVRAMRLDLASFASISAFASQFLALGLPLHALVLNAGVMKSPGAAFVGRPLHYGYEETRDGFEAHIGVNHLGHFLLYTLLEGALKASAPSRVVAVSAAAEVSAYAEGIRPDLWHARGTDYEDGRAYGQSKLANILFARELAHRLHGTGVAAFSCHPGVIRTELARHMEAEFEAQARAKGLVAQAASAAFSQLFALALMSPADGALTQLMLATSERPLLPGGYYWPVGDPVQPKHPQAHNLTLQRLLWAWSEEAVRGALPAEGE